jgi:outer membrane lipoprotein LolB
MPPRDPLTPISLAEPEWQGRLSVVVYNTPSQAMSANFLLRGNSKLGALDLYSPLGTTLAAVRWSPGSVVWLQGSSEQRFDNLAALTEHATGAALPVTTLFDWLQGLPASAPGWQADLSALPNGLLMAKRTTPLPEVVLRLKLD